MSWQLINQNLNKFLRAIDTSVRKPGEKVKKNIDFQGRVASCNGNINHNKVPSSNDGRTFLELFNTPMFSLLDNLFCRWQKICKDSQGWQSSLKALNFPFFHVISGLKGNTFCG